MSRRIPALLGLCLCLAPALAFAAAPITVSDAWIRLLPGDVPLAGYFTLHNNGDKPIQLTLASSPAFKRIEMHHSMAMHGMDKMMPVKTVEVPAHGTFSFSPGGYHLMLWRGRGLRIGEQIPITLKFADGWQVRATFVVKGPNND